MEKTVFLTGGAGRIGRLVLKQLLERGYRVKALIHRHEPEGISDKNLELIRGDILDQNGMTEAVKRCRFVCHLAAAWDMFPPAVFEKENNQLFESIVRGTYNLLEASYSQKDIELFLYASTDAVYATGPRKFDAPITEDTEMVPSRFYALCKIVCESMCKQYGKLYGLPWLLVRICWALAEDEILRIYSYEFWKDSMSPEDSERLAPRLADGKGVFAPLLQNGESGIDHIADPQDIADGIVLSIEKYKTAKNNTYNLAGPAPFRYLDVIEKVADGLGVPWDSAKVDDFQPYELRNDRAEKYLGYKPKYTMELMIEKALLANSN
jgi:nucleoside-diphosphate-sugar epimerase